MGSRRVPLIRGQYYHIYNRAIAGNLLFREERNYIFFLSRIEMYILPSAELIAYCLMPNHYHFILKLITNNISDAMKRLALSYTKSYQVVYDQKGHLFQGPFRRSLISDLNYLVHLSRYIHLNPVKANLVQQAERWDHSSYQEYIGLRETDYLNPAPILSSFEDGPDTSISSMQTAYQRFVEQWEFEYMEFKLKK